MRIISGTARRRVLDFCESPVVRPTKERIRQALFNVLVHRFKLNFEQTTVLEGFGGTGIFSFEAVSLGSQNVWCVEQDPIIAHLIQKQAKQFGMDRVIRVVTTDLLTFQTSESFGLVFLDPPYNGGLVKPALHHVCSFLAPEAVVVVECRKKDIAPLQEELQNLPQLSLQTFKTYGKIALLFLQSTSKR